MHTIVAKSFSYNERIYKESEDQSEMKAETYPFVMRPLPYEYYALAPCLSAETLMYHHDKHYRTYVANLNKALADYPLLQKLSLKELLSGLENLPVPLQTAVKNNGGGVYNHELYFDCMHPVDNQDPKGSLLDAITRDYGSLHEFKERMKTAAMGRFGSGYAWLVIKEDEGLQILTTANQNTPNLKKEVPILVIDVWEHAYYLQYQNRRDEYVDAWLKLINWRKVAARYEEGIQETQKRVMDHGKIPEIGSLPSMTFKPEIVSDGISKQSPEHSQAATDTAQPGSGESSQVTL